MMPSKFQFISGDESTNHRLKKKETMNALTTLRIDENQDK